MARPGLGNNRDVHGFARQRAVPASGFDREFELTGAAGRPIHGEGDHGGAAGVGILSLAQHRAIQQDADAREIGSGVFDAGPARSRWRRPETSDRAGAKRYGFEARPRNAGAGISAAGKPRLHPLAKKTSADQVNTNQRIDSVSAPPLISALPPALSLTWPQLYQNGGTIARWEDLPSVGDMRALGRSIVGTARRRRPFVSLPRWVI